jgi:hypothetical protein
VWESKVEESACRHRPRQHGVSVVVLDDAAVRMVGVRDAVVARMVGVRDTVVARMVGVRDAVVVRMVGDRRGSHPCRRSQSRQMLQLCACRSFSLRSESAEAPPFRCMRIRR